MEMFQVWLMPENKVKGNEDKWIAKEDIVEAKNRKEVTKELHAQNKSGSWKVRRV